MDCPYIPITSYSEFSQQLLEKATSQRFPISGSVEVTARCNLGCAFCYINIPVGDQKARKKELTYQEWCNVLDQIVDEGCLWLLLTGGEPFIRPDFLNIYKYAKQKGLIITLFTNGTTITPRIADVLAEWRPFSIEITLYGLTQETYERITGVSGSYERCIRGIELLVERELPLKLKSVVSKENWHEINDIKSFAEGLGLGFRFDPELNSRLDGDKRPHEFRISPQDIVTLDLLDENRLEAWHDFSDQFGGKTQDSEFLYQCGAGRSTFHIDAYGQLSICMMAREPGYDLRSGSFREGWRDPISSVLAQKWTRESDCQHCELNYLCSWCPGWGLVENGDREASVDYLCEITHLRAKTLRLLESERRMYW